MNNTILKHIHTPEFWAKLDYNRFGIMPLSITLQSCMGSVAVAYISDLPDHLIMIPLILISTITMAANAMAIAQASIKLVIISFILSTMTSIILTIYALAMA